MANQKTTELRRLFSTDVASGDWIPIVDVSELTSPTGETKKISAGDFSEYVVSGGLLNYAAPQHGYQNSNGLSFEANVAPLDELNMYCYGTAPTLYADFSLTVRAFIPSDAYLSDTSRRVLFGIGSQVIGMADSGSRVYVGVQSSSLIAYINDGTTEKVIEYSNFLNLFPDRAFEATITKEYTGDFKFYINSSLVGAVTGAPLYINGTYTTMGNGQSGSHWNINSVVYEAHVFDVGLTSANVRQNYYGGVRNNQSGLVASYRSENLNPGPTQWLDSVGDNHLLLPRQGAEATSPTKQFGLIFFNDGTSGYLGNGTQRDVLPENYVLTDCFVYSPGAPLLSVGSSPNVAVPGDSGIYSFNNNRVPLVSASYGRNALPLLDLGIAHTDRSLYVFYSASAAPCTFSFQGYVSKYGAINYIPPSPTPTPTPTMTVTPSETPPAPTPTTTSTPTETPPLPPGIYLSANSYRLDDAPFVFTNNTAITSLPRYKLRVKARELVGTVPRKSLEHRVDTYNTNYLTLNNPPVGLYTTDLYYVEYGTSPDIYGNYPVLSVNGGAAFTTVTMSVATASTFTPPPYPGPDVYLSATTFSLSNPAYIYTGNSSVTSYDRYRLRCKVVGHQAGVNELTLADGASAEQRSVAYNNNYSEIISPEVGKWQAELYWVTYNSSYVPTVQPAPWQNVTMSITTASGFIPVSPPGYIPANHPNVYLSSTTGTTTTFTYNNPPYIYCTDPSVLTSPSYRLRCKARYFNTTTSTWDLLPGSTEHRAIAWDNQYQIIYPPAPGVYKFELYWIKYPLGLFQTNGGVVYTGSAYTVDVTITP